jgi:hypothetical protein
MHSRVVPHDSIKSKVSTFILLSVNRIRLLKKEYSSTLKRLECWCRNLEIPTSSFPEPWICAWRSSQETSCIIIKQFQQDTDNATIAKRLPLILMARLHKQRNPEHCTRASKSRR